MICMKRFIKFKNTKKFMFMFTFISGFSAGLTYLINPNINEVMASVSSRIPEKISQSEGLQLVIEYVKHNGFIVPFQMLLLDLLPIPLFYLAQPIMTAVLPGILFRIALRYNIKEGGF